MITYRATLDVARPIGQFVAQLLTEHRRAVGTRRGRRALGPFAQAVLVLRWFRDATPVARLATDSGIGVATAYRYLHEGITVLAAQAHDLPEVLTERLAAGDTHLIVDGTLIRTTRVAGTVIKTKGRTAGQPVHRWYSGKHRAFGGNIQFLATADGFPLWCSEVLPGRHNDLDAARTHARHRPPVRRRHQRPAHPGRQGLPLRRHRHPHPHQSRPRPPPPPRHPPRPRPPHLQPTPHQPALPRRTRRRHPQNPLASTPPHHPQPHPHRHHHPSSPRPHPTRTPRPLLRKPHWGRWSTPMPHWGR